MIRKLTLSLLLLALLRHEPNVTTLALKFNAELMRSTPLEVPLLKTLSDCIRSFEAALGAIAVSQHVGYVEFQSI